jgi:hypothetical protein
MHKLILDRKLITPLEYEARRKAILSMLRESMRNAQG